MQNNLIIKSPIEGLLGEWIDIRNYVNYCIFFCSKCNIFFTYKNARVYYIKECTICNELCNSKYIWYNHTNLSNDVISSNKKNLSNDIISITTNLFQHEENNGIWLESRNIKSFGIFQCLKCKINKNNKLKQWTSAYANSKYPQKCTTCNIDYYPKFMWINHSNNHTNNKKYKKEHLTALCGGCKKNDCKYINKII